MRLVVVIDNGPSSARPAFGSLTLLDAAKGSIEAWVKHRTSQRRADGNAAPDEYCLVCSAPAGSSALSYARHPSSGVDTAASGSLGSAALAAEQALAAGTARVLCTPTTDATEFMHAVAEERR
ncbi:hypothetical protein FNF29_01783 [Cafeteria roenbergensis]|uniref:Uncharacterized protein n=1 Tax=Cafeteria roenbergensis TaxID=33653 RepID=A0A5A8E302_CAFRO|nr:hypothetical protein FNF29_01783 [Cafeteria roenbergensis]KAA0170271.1 hypothetical protein FNF28_01499 [Cafeteria roenbergensis]|eukprot:KAA0155408.1 hypothetical protein FNF29_01783 [Cafeteria roenbergensis]